ncbi:disease resistance protein RPM1-like [Quercus robur]|uniref:disease resistance protein RPM1-like n=1 Tax=Quercus robur TaxID=38942 RepID=UPI0021631DB0|nr:disease resistance protein RPM1-like [Quercus robur]
MIQSFLKDADVKAEKEDTSNVVKIWVKQSEELLRNMIKQFYKSRKELVPVEIDTMKETPLMEQLRLYLHEHRLPILPSEKAWELFCKKVFQNEGRNCPPKLVELSHAIVERCEGLPLAIVAISGLLSTKDKVFYEFHKLHNSLSSELKKEVQGITLEEVAHGYLNKLIHRILVQVEDVDLKERKFCQNCLTTFNSEQCKYSFEEYY